MTELTLTQRIAQQHDWNTPTCVLALGTLEFAGEADAGYRAGLRSTDDWLVELEPCTLDELEALRTKYGANNVHLLLNDDSVPEAAWREAQQQYEHDLYEAREQLRTECACNALRDGDLNGALRYMVQIAQEAGYELRFPL